MEEYLLEMTGIEKYFPGVHALKGVDLKIKSGEIHTLIGENGAGKSCLIKILTGIYKKDAGKIIFDGTEQNPTSSLQMRQVGISTIYQELNLLPNLSVGENIFLTREPRKKGGLIDWDKVYRDSEEILGNLGIHVDVKRKLNTFGTALQQMTAIAKAVSVDAKLLVMDEPTSSLDGKEVEEIFRVMRQLKAQGTSILFVSHRLSEIFQITDRITVLKDGECVGVHNVDEISHLELVTEMIGRDASQVVRARKPYNPLLENAEEMLSAKGIASGSRLFDASMTIAKGEILGLAGLLGSGRSETVKTCFGAEHLKKGSIQVKGKTMRLRSPHDAIQQKIALCPEDRKVEGIFPNMSVRDNIAIIILPHLSKFGVMNRRKQSKIVSEYIEKLGIKTPNDRQKVKFLSGGNQQKVILARWLCAQPELIMLDEPTRGIDVGAKAEIESLIQQFAKDGISVLMISSELEEVERNCDRVIVMREGKTIGEVNHEELTKTGIMDIIAAPNP